MAPGLQTIWKVRSGKARIGDDATRSCRQGRGAFGHARKSWSHLAARTENENVTGEQCERPDGGLIGFAEETFEDVNVSD